ncbi:MULTISPECIES: MraY family glycosyltransferase [Halomonadaceae]|uniref:Glycosyl transferase n=1 Tax=Vreelandella halophila TaxID=86177 RepID=A0A9X4Y938_9GAMM|nr:MULTISPECIES: glycosyltransferase family 4 protein [Halomonas]MYL25276.1 glycosyl transferase [Halomonas utahensis]MYL75338.1 glycosyl transferase [Halomonas sp. 22501_18_FS]
MSTQPLLIMGAFIVTTVLTGAFRRYALSRSLIDVPNARSSHQVPTPRGGGLAVVIVVLAALALMPWSASLEPRVGIALGGAGLIVASVGFLDDHAHVAARWRLLGHFLAAGWGLYWLGGLPAIVLWQAPVDLGLAGHLLAAVFLVWLLNLYNFMDGINGIAGIELITVALGGMIVGAVAGVQQADLLLAVLIASGLGFLAWNFPQARIFMGDACSGFLGLVLGLIAVWQGLLQAELFIAWVILLGTFLVDATLTLLRRILRGEPFYEAHRSHAYQVASRHYGSHAPVSLAFGLINLLWLTPMALLLLKTTVPPALILTAAFAPLVIIALWFRAGASE